MDTTREERRVVTALFADLVGSTELVRQLDPEEGRLVVGEAIARIVREIEAFEGYVKDLAGDGVLAFFGAPLAWEDDAERAARAGLRIVAAIAAYGREVESSWGVAGFSVRVGLGTGPVLMGSLGSGSRVEYAAFGETVNRAARLQAEAQPGSVLIDGPTYRALEGLVQAGEAVPLKLKGFTDPVHARVILGLQAGPSGHRLARRSGSQLVGRDRDLAAAGEWVERVRGGSGGVLVISGEAGIGKSRLAAELQRRFHEAPADGVPSVWLEGRCASFGKSLPLWPFRDLLRGWLGVADEPELRVRVLLRRRTEALFGARAAEMQPYLATVLGLSLEPEAAARLGQLSPESLQYRTFEVVGELLQQLADKGPVVVALDDLHWADPSSIQLILRLLPLAEQSAILLLITHRPERDHGSWALREQAARQYPHLLREIALEPLAGDAQRRLLSALPGGEVLPEPLAGRLLLLAEGNPFFLEELVRSLVDAGALVGVEGGWRFDQEVAIEMPASVERLVVARIDRLDATCHHVVTAAAALGRRFGRSLLQGVVDEGTDVEAALHELQRLDLIRTERRWPHPEYRFKHALIQEAAYRLLGGPARTALHRQAALWLERAHAANLEEVVGLLAHHWQAARDDERAIDYLTRAADRARDAHALDEAIELYRRLLPLLEPRGERRAIALALFKLGLALHTALRFGEANATFARAFEHWERPPAHPAPTATLRVVEPKLPEQADPPRSYSLSNMRLQMALFDRLVERWPEATIVPSLAERWEVSDDGLRYQFRLREGLRWSDGEPLTAADVEYAIKRGLDPARPAVSASLFYVLEGAQDYAQGRCADARAVGVRALDERTVEFRLVAPAPYFLSLVNRPDAGPLPRHAIERYGDDWIAAPHRVVSGAYREVERSAHRLVLERRAESKRPGGVRRVEMLTKQGASPDDQTVDIVIDPSLAPGAEPDPLVQLGPSASTGYLVFAFPGASAHSLELRRALALAIDRSALAEALPGTMTVATGGLVPPALQGHTPGAALPFDPDAARASLERSGFQGRVTLTAAAGSSRFVDPIARSWREVLGDLVEVRLLPPEAWSAVDGNGIGDVALMGWTPGYPDPEYFLRLLLHSASSDNFGRWSHPAYDTLIEQARAEPDGRMRLERFHRADRMAVAEQVSVIPIVYIRDAFRINPRVRGWWTYGKSWSSYADLAVDPAG